MKRTRVAVLGALTIATVGGLVMHAAPVHAQSATTCVVPNIYTVVVEGVGDVPCEQIEELCITAPTGGPSRAVHPQGGAVVNPPEGCGAFEPECVLTVLEPLPPGPTRVIHSAAPSPVLPAAGLRPGEFFDYGPCLDLPEAGFDTAPFVIAALAAIGVGLVITQTRRVLVRRAN